MLPFLLPILLGLFATVLVLATISKESIADAVRSWWGSRQNVVVLSPSTNAKLARIAQQSATRRHKRFIFLRETGESRLVESDSIDKALAPKEVHLFVQ